MSTGLFADEESGYNSLEPENLEETKYVLKGSAPSTDSSVDAIEEPSAEEAPMDDLGGLEDAPAEDKPFDDEPFDAEVDADEDTDPAKYIQQLSGKLGQSLRQYSEDEGQPDFDLEKFAVNSVLSATHTGEMDKEDQRDIINQVKGAGNDEGGEEGGEAEVDVDIDADVDADIEGGEEDLDFGSEEEVEEIVEELPLNQGDELPQPTDCSMGMEPVDSEALAALKNVAELKESKKSRTSVDEAKHINSTELPSFAHNPNDFKTNDPKRFYDAMVTRNSDGLIGRVLRSDEGKLKVKITDGEHTGKVFYAYPSELKMNEGLKESKINRIFVDKTKLIKDLRLMENAEPMVEPKPITKPTTKPSKPMREADRPFAPKRRVGVQPDPKAEDNDMITDSE